MLAHSTHFFFIYNNIFLCRISIYLFVVDLRNNGGSSDGSTNTFMRSYLTIPGYECLCNIWCELRLSQFFRYFLSRSLNVIVLLNKNKHVQSIYWEMAWFRCLFLLNDGGAHLIMGVQ